MHYLLKILSSGISVALRLVPFSKDKNNGFQFWQGEIEENIVMPNSAREKINNFFIFFGNLEK